MTIDELEDKYFELLGIKMFKGTKWEETSILGLNETVELSIQFAIEVLEELYSDNFGVCLECNYGESIQSKIQELKQHLNEKV